MIEVKHSSGLTKQFDDEHLAKIMVSAYRAGSSVLATAKAMEGQQKVLDGEVVKVNGYQIRLIG